MGARLLAPGEVMGGAWMLAPVHGAGGEAVAPRAGPAVPGFPLLGFPSAALVCRAHE